MRLLPLLVSQQVARRSGHCKQTCVVHQGGLLNAAHNSKLSHDVGAAVAAVSLQDCEGEKSTVAAFHPGAGCSQRGSGQQGGASQPGSKKSRRGGGSGSGQQVTHTVSHAEWDQASASPNMLIDLSDQALLDSTGRRLAGLARPSPPKATVVALCSRTLQPQRFPLRPTLLDQPSPEQPSPEQPCLQPTPPDLPAR